MGELGYIQWPCRDESEADQGTSYLFKETFDTPNGLAQFFTCDWVAPIDKLTDEYPMVLSTVREVGHYSCRSMTGNCAALAALADEPGYAQINTADAERLGIEDEALVWVNSRKGRIITRAQEGHSGEEYFNQHVHDGTVDNHRDGIRYRMAQARLR